MSSTENSQNTSRAWWKESSVYQIYPASFKDSNNDGIGDIPGIISKLDYIKSLGVDIVWLSPILQSPQVDMGYDVSDYKKIHESYGTLDDVDDLIAGLHSRGMKYVMDLVVNHTSDQHEWFRESRASTQNKFRDWYIWRKPRYDEEGRQLPPNNWSSYFGGSAWEYDKQTNEYYLHLFATEQPDLNWENQEVRNAVHSIVRFWLDKGVDGFRLDVINFISKVGGLPDAPVTEPGKQWQHGATHYACGPRLHEYLRDLGAIFKEYDAFSVGEMPFVFQPAEILKSVGFDRQELSMVFQFEIVDIDHGREGRFTPGKWKMADLKSIVNKWQTFMIENNGWNALVLESHDQGRAISRFASDKPKWREIASKMVATFMGFQSGTVFIYQGQELAQANVPESWTIDMFRDIETLNHWKGLGESNPSNVRQRQVAMSQYKIKSRDNARTPIQWDGSRHAGFTTNDRPWIDVHEDYRTWNVASQVTRPDSAYNYWAAMLRLRKELPNTFVYGDFKLVSPENEDIFAYLRTYDEFQSALVVANFREDIVDWRVPAEAARYFTGQSAAIGNYEKPPTLSDATGAIQLRPFEAFVLVNRPDRQQSAEI
ncbi:hypothetical protein V500_00837 [Pseudogymnoascus sp. VKM F-4518 (FW-2643)]|nr:hypothetical protein V500_00837 [Pseudogymnoascus sp. VKM F-4518 (FW-2643)]